MCEFVFNVPCKHSYICIWLFAFVLSILSNPGFFTDNHLIMSFFDM